MILKYGSLIEHNLQVLTGFSLLGAHVVEDCCLPAPLLIAEAGGKHIAYDSHDGWKSFVKDERFRSSAHQSDLYFRRSLNASKYLDEELAEKMRPLAPNYLCYNEDVCRLAYTGIRGLILRGKQGNCHFERFEPEETLGGNGKIVFLTRLWNPGDPEVETEEARMQRERINAMRIGIVRALRSEYGTRAICGLQKSPYALQVAPNLVIGRGKTVKPFYLSEMKRASVCISSLGVHDSNGWKFGEYIAAGRAIVAERPVYEVPYASDGNNYLVFDDIDGCMCNVERLMASRSLREEMQRCNREYYTEHLRPDKLVLDSLRVAGVELGT